LDIGHTEATACFPPDEQTAGCEDVDLYGRESIVKIKREIAGDDLGGDPDILKPVADFLRHEVQQVFFCHSSVPKTASEESAKHAFVNGDNIFEGIFQVACGDSRPEILFAARDVFEHHLAAWHRRWLSKSSMTPAFRWLPVSHRGLYKNNRCDARRRKHDPACLVVNELGTGGILAPVILYAPAGGKDAQLRNIHDLKPTFP